MIIIVKHLEVVEILFQESLIKVLFSTETFAMGINMPAKTVVFTNTRKWDGLEYRILLSGEYIQMAGRAGRRGKDDRGLCIIMFDEKVEPETAKSMFLGSATKIYSAFHLGYNMLINLLRLEGASPDHSKIVRYSKVIIVSKFSFILCLYMYTYIYYSALI